MPKLEMADMALKVTKNFLVNHGAYTQPHANYIIHLRKDVLFWTP